MAPTHVDAAAEAYRADVEAAIGEEVGVLESFVLGSGLVGGYRPGESDLDLVVVVDAPLQGEPRRRAIERIAAFERPGRRLELVVYVLGQQPPDFELNLEVDDDGAREAPDELDHWFVIDAGMAQERIPAWTDYFEPIPEDRLRVALGRVRHNEVAGVTTPGRRTGPSSNSPGSTPLVRAITSSTASGSQSRR